MGKKQFVFNGLEKISDLVLILGEEITNPKYKQYAVRGFAYNIYFIGKRKIEAPVNQLKIIQKKIATNFGVLSVPTYLYTFRSAISNASCHFTANQLAKLDISNFFPSCTASRVFNLFHQRYHCSKVVSSKLTDLLTLQRHLPTGSPASPMLAFWAYKNMWDKVAQLCSKNGCKLTVYMDDLTISGPEVNSGLLNGVMSLIEKEGFTIHPAKNIQYSREEAREVTGVLMTVGDRFEILPKLLEKQREIEKLVNGRLPANELDMLKQRQQGIEAYIAQVAKQKKDLTVGKVI